jgi:hypothetical protein
MKKFINSVDGVLAESLDGLAAAHADLVALGPEPKFVRRRELNPKKVALVSGGGSRHEPLHAGFVGYGMLDAACPGQVFTSPTPDQIVEAQERLQRPSALAHAKIILKIPAPKEFLARRGLGHRIPARIAHLCHVRFYAGSDTAGARLNTGNGSHSRHLQSRNVSPQ